MPTLELEVIDECGADNEAGLSEADVQKLKQGGAASDMEYLYPYDETVFPRGLKAPLLMWQGADATALYVHIRSQYFEYEGCFKPTAEGQLQLEQEVWDKAGQHTLGPRTPYTLELTALVGGSARGPISRTLTIAQATLKGSIYYNSYNSQLAGGSAALGFGGIGSGAIMRIRPGQDVEYFLRQDVCTGCHAVSANGERLVATEIGEAPGQVYELEPDSSPNPEPKTAATNASFVGLSPDGAVYISTAVKGGVGPSQAATFGGGFLGDIDSLLFETDTGMTVEDSSVPTSALMPTFSPDGTLIVFNDYMQGMGKGLSLMDYDADARKATNARAFYTGSERYAGWPFLFPDNRGVIFTECDNADFGGGGAGIFLPAGPRSDLMIADVERGKAVMLARAMGFANAEDAAADRTYLPFGQEELHQSYYPTVSPVAGGGYFWVFFDSMRHYGNLGLQRQLWGTAITIHSDGDYSTDPSHPAFYLSGQELSTANHRAFTALDPCRADGDNCETGIDCCSGFCTNGVCGPPQDKCAGTDEACEVDADCCNEGDQCLGGFCGVVIVQ